MAKKITNPTEAMEIMQRYLDCKEIERRPYGHATFTFGCDEAEADFEGNFNPIRTIAKQYEKLMLREGCTPRDRALMRWFVNTFRQACMARSESIFAPTIYETPLDQLKY